MQQVVCVEASAGPLRRHQAAPRRRSPPKPQDAANQPQACRGAQSKLWPLSDKPKLIDSKTSPPCRRQEEASYCARTCDERLQNCSNSSGATTRMRRATEMRYFQQAPPATGNKWRSSQVVAAAAATTKNDDYDYDDCKQKLKPKSESKLAKPKRPTSSNRRRTKTNTTSANKKLRKFAGGDFSSSSSLRALFVSVAISLICLTATGRFAFREVAGSAAAKLSAGTSAGANQASGGQVATAGATAASDFGCPYPAVHPNCQVNIVAQAPAVPLISTEFVADEYATLKPDTQAAYKCDPGFELLGQATVTCLPSGRWSASPPNCVTNIALGKPTNQSSTVKGGDSRNANDGKLITQHEAKYCTETRVDQSPWWQIDLLQVYEIRSVRILGRACCNPQLSLHDVEIRVGNSSTLQGNRLCAWYPNNLEEGVARDFQCAHPIYGRFVSIQMVGIESALSLCEVMVFSTKEFPAERCNIQTTLGPSSDKLQPTTTVSSTTSLSTTTQQSLQSGTGLQNNQVVVFNRTCYETQATSGGSFLVADTYCKARGGSLLHSVNELTHSFISQELERMKAKLKSKLVWLGAKRENASPNAQGPVTSGSSSALFASDSIPSKSFSASFNEFPIESLFSPDQILLSSSESSPIFSPLKLSRTSLLQTSSGAGGTASRGSQTFGLPHSSQHHHPPANRSAEHSGRSLIISQPNQIASFFTPPIPIDSPLPNSPKPPTNVLPPPSLTSPNPIAYSASNQHVHRTLRPPSLVSSSSSSSTSQSGSSSQPSSQSSWGSSNTAATTIQSSQAPQVSGGWRWIGDAPSETLMSPVTSFLWAEDQPNNYNNQQDCIVMDGGKKWLWNDVTCELDYLPWICQYRPSTCGSPDKQENSTILELTSSSQGGSSSSSSGFDPNFQFGKTITYACPVGHRLDGSKSRRCLYDGTWSGRAPKCHYVNCGPVGSNIENGRTVYLNQSQTTYGSQIKYVCFEDYVLVGDDTRQCQADGKWDGKQPYCAYKWCPVLQQISNGILNVSSYSENSIASYQCNGGYKLIGNDTRQCLLGGKWTNQEPFCQYVECGQPKQIPNGSYQLLNGTTNYLSIVSYTCNENYTLVGNNNKMTCSHNNRWTGREPQCSLIDCGQPQANPGSRYFGDSFTVHSTIDYKCDPGFKEVSGNAQRTCSLDGQWSGQALTCKYVDCGRVPAILKGEVSYINGTTYLASQVSYECTPGNRLSGHKMRFCGPDGRWTGTSPKCEEVRCDVPELPANGSAVYIGNDRSFKEKSFSVGVTVQYECDYGHVVRGSWSSRLCQANGEWSGEPPVCRFIDCGTPPTIENGNYVLKHPPGSSPSIVGVGSATPVEMARRSDGPQIAGATFTYYGTIAHYNCDANYKLQGPSQRECLETGQWRVPLPTCEPVQCPKPEYFDEFTQVALLSRANQPDGAPSSDHQTLSALVAKHSIKLIANNQWINQDSSQSYGVGDKLYYSCVPGYELYGGPEARTCTQYGQWSGSSTPRCRLIDCGRPAPIGQEGRFYLLNETTTFNSLVEYSCVRPFKLVEVKIRQAGNLIETLTTAQAGVTLILTSLPIGVKVCANNGQWMPNDQQPRCTSSDAPLDSGISSNGQFDGGDNTLEGSNRVASSSNNHQTFLGSGGANSNNYRASDNGGIGGNNLDQSVASGGHHEASAQAESTSLWAKIIIAICLLVMLAIIILTLICIKSGKKPKQVRASILTPGGRQAAAAAAAMQIQLASSKGIKQQQQPPSSQHQTRQSAIAMQSNAVPMMSGQNIYINGMHKAMFAGQMVSQSQLSNLGAVNPAAAHLHRHHHLEHAAASMMAPYGDASAANLVLANSANGARSMISLSEQGGEVMLNGAKSLGMLSHHPQNQMSASSSSIMDSYSRLSIDSDQSNMLGQHAGNKTIRHNPNGLVTFVSPAAQQQNNRNAGQQPSSSGHTTSATSQPHQVSPQSISTSLSVSSSSSPSSSSSAHHTTATRLSSTDSTASPSSGSTSRHHHHNGHSHHQHDADQQQLGHQSQPPFMQAPPVPQSSPPSLPAHPPPSHRVQQYHKQLVKHQQHPSRQVAGGGGQSSIGAQRQVPSGRSSLDRQQLAAQNQTQSSAASSTSSASSDHHYMEPTL